MNREHSTLTVLLYAGTPLLVFCVDLLSKQVVEATLAEGKPLRVVGDLFQLTLVYNYGTTFGLFSTSAPWLTISLVKLTFICALIACLVSVDRFIMGVQHQMVARICLLAIIGGSCGNLVDRLADQRVTDFIDIGIQAFRWPVFNLGDAFQVVGGLTILGIMTLQAFRGLSAHG